MRIILCIMCLRNNKMYSSTLSVQPMKVLSDSFFISVSPFHLFVGDYTVMPIDHSVILTGKSSKNI